MENGYNVGKRLKQMGDILNANLAFKFTFYLSRCETNVNFVDCLTQSAINLYEAFRAKPAIPRQSNETEKIMGMAKKGNNKTERTKYYYSKHKHTLGFLLQRGLYPQRKMAD